MLGVVGKIQINYMVNKTEYEETIELNEEKEYYLKGCERCKLTIDEIDYIVDTVYCVSVYFGDNETEPITVFGNSSVDFEVKEYNIEGTIRIIVI